MNTTHQIIKTQDNTTTQHNNNTNELVVVITLVPDIVRPPFKTYSYCSLQDKFIPVLFITIILGL